jgi:hypothetical protein
MNAVERGFVLDQWCMAAWSDEVDSSLRSRMVRTGPVAMGRRQGARQVLEQQGAQARGHHAELAADFG